MKYIFAVTYGAPSTASHAALPPPLRKSALCAFLEKVETALVLSLYPGSLRLNSALSLSCEVAPNIVKEDDDTGIVSDLAPFFYRIRICIDRNWI